MAGVRLRFAREVILVAAVMASDKKVVVVLLGVGSMTMTKTKVVRSKTVHWTQTDPEFVVRRNSREVRSPERVPGDVWPHVQAACLVQARRRAWEYGGLHVQVDTLIQSTR